LPKESSDAQGRESAGGKISGHAAPNYQVSIINQLVDIVKNNLGIWKFGFRSKMELGFARYA